MSSEAPGSPQTAPSLEDAKRALEADRALRIAAAKVAIEAAQKQHRVTLEIRRRVFITNDGRIECDVEMLLIPE